MVEEPPAGARRMGVLRKILIANLFVTLPVLLLVEAGSRLLVPTELPSPLVSDDERGGLVHVQDRHLFWKRRPNLVRDGVRVSNSHGLRGDEIPPKGTDEFRILSLGESTTASMWLPVEDTYSGLLESALGQVDGKAVRVINAGVPGYTLFQGTTYLRLFGLAFEPDAVFVYFGYNDSLPVSYRGGISGDAWGVTDRELFEARSGLGNRIAGALLRTSNAARFFAQLGSTAQPVALGQRPRVPEEDRRWLFSELRALCREKGIRLVVIVPWYLSYRDHVPLLRELADEDDLLLVDLPAALDAIPEPRERFFRDAFHPTAEGHRRIAAEIERALRADWNASAPAG